MSDILERELVAAPSPSAGRFLTAFLAANPGPHGEGSRVILHAANFSEPAIVSIAHVLRPGDMTPRYSVHWEAERTENFPVFDGILSVESDEDYDSFWLVVKGSYKPPGGLVGKAFDVLVGKHLAAETTRNLLTAIRDAVQAAFAREEQSKTTPAKPANS